MSTTGNDKSSSLFKLLSSIRKAINDLCALNSHIGSILDPIADAVGHAVVDIGKIGEIGLGGIVRVGNGPQEAVIVKIAKMLAPGIAFSENELSSAMDMVEKRIMSINVSPSSTLTDYIELIEGIKKIINESSNGVPPIVGSSVNEICNSIYEYMKNIRYVYNNNMKKVAKEVTEYVNDLSHKVSSMETLVRTIPGISDSELTFMDAIFKSHAKTLEKLTGILGEVMNIDESMLTIQPVNTSIKSSMEIITGSFTNQRGLLEEYKILNKRLTDAKIDIPKLKSIQDMYDVVTKHSMDKDSRIKLLEIIGKIRSMMPDDAQIINFFAILRESGKLDKVGAGDNMLADTYGQQCSNAIQSIGMNAMSAIENYTYNISNNEYDAAFVEISKILKNIDGFGKYTKNYDYYITTLSNYSACLTTIRGCKELRSFADMLEADFNSLATTIGNIKSYSETNEFKFNDSFTVDMTDIINAIELTIKGNRIFRGFSGQAGMKASDEMTITANFTDSMIMKRTKELHEWFTTKKADNKIFRYGACHHQLVGGANTEDKFKKLTAAFATMQSEKYRKQFTSAASQNQEFNIVQETLGFNSTPLAGTNLPTTDNSIPAAAAAIAIADIVGNSCVKDIYTSFGLDINEQNTTRFIQDVVAITVNINVNNNYNITANGAALSERSLFRIYTQFCLPVCDLEPVNKDQAKDYYMNGVDALWKLCSKIEMLYIENPTIEDIAISKDDIMRIMKSITIFNPSVQVTDPYLNYAAHLDDLRINHILSNIELSKLIALYASINRVSEHDIQEIWQLIKTVMLFCYTGLEPVQNNQDEIPFHNSCWNSKSNFMTRLDNDEITKHPAGVGYYTGIVGGGPAPPARYTPGVTPGTNISYVINPLGIPAMVNRFAPTGAFSVVQTAEYPLKLEVEWFEKLIGSMWGRLHRFITVFTIDNMLSMQIKHNPRDTIGYGNNAFNIDYVEHYYNLITYALWIADIVKSFNTSNPNQEVQFGHIEYFGQMMDIIMNADTYTNRINNCYGIINQEIRESRYQSKTPTDVLKMFVDSVSSSFIFSDKSKVLSVKPDQKLNNVGYNQTFKLGAVANISSYTNQSIKNQKYIRPSMDTEKLGLHVTHVDAFYKTLLNHIPETITEHVNVIDTCRTKYTLNRNADECTNLLFKTVYNESVNSDPIGCVKADIDKIGSGKREVDALVMFDFEMKMKYDTRVSHENIERITNMITQYKSFERMLLSANANPTSKNTFDKVFTVKGLVDIGMSVITDFVTYMYDSLVNYTLADHNNRKPILFDSDYVKLFGFLVDCMAIETASVHYTTDILNVANKLLDSANGAAGTPNPELKVANITALNAAQVSKQHEPEYNIFNKLLTAYTVAAPGGNAPATIGFPYAYISLPYPNPVNLVTLTGGDSTSQVRFDKVRRIVMYHRQVVLSDINKWYSTQPTDPVGWDRRLNRIKTCVKRIITYVIDNRSADEYLKNFSLSSPTSIEIVNTAGGLDKIVDFIESCIRTRGEYYSAINIPYEISTPTSTYGIYTNSTYTHESKISFCRTKINRLEEELVAARKESEMQLLPFTNTKMDNCPFIKIPTTDCNKVMYLDNYCVMFNPERYHNYPVAQPSKFGFSAFEVMKYNTIRLTDENKISTDYIKEFEKQFASATTTTPGVGTNPINEAMAMAERNGEIEYKRILRILTGTGDASEQTRRSGFNTINKAAIKMKEQYIKKMKNIIDRTINRNKLAIEITENTAPTIKIPIVENSANHSHADGSAVAFRVITTGANTAIPPNTIYVDEAAAYVAVQYNYVRKHFNRVSLMIPNEHIPYCITNTTVIGVGVNGYNAPNSVAIDVSQVKRGNVAGGAVVIPGNQMPNNAALALANYPNFVGTRGLDRIPTIANGVLGENNYTHLETSARASEDLRVKVNVYDQVMKVKLRLEALDKLVTTTYAAGVNNPPLMNVTTNINTIDLLCGAGADHTNYTDKFHAVSVAAALSDDYTWCEVITWVNKFYANFIDANGGAPAGSNARLLYIDGAQTTEAIRQAAAYVHTTANAVVTAAGAAPGHTSSWTVATGVINILSKLIGYSYKTTVVGCIADYIMSQADANSVHDINSVISLITIAAYSYVAANNTEPNTVLIANINATTPNSVNNLLTTSTDVHIAAAITAASISSNTGVVAFARTIAAVGVWGTPNTIVNRQVRGVGYTVFTAATIQSITVANRDFNISTNAAAVGESVNINVNKWTKASEQTNLYTFAEYVSSNLRIVKNIQSKSDIYRNFTGITAHAYEYNSIAAFGNVGYNVALADPAVPNGEYDSFIRSIKDRFKYVINKYSQLVDLHPDIVAYVNKFGSNPIMDAINILEKSSCYDTATAYAADMFIANRAKDRVLPFSQLMFNLQDAGFTPRQVIQSLIGVNSCAELDPSNLIHQAIIDSAATETITAGNMVPGNSWIIGNTDIINKRLQLSESQTAKEAGKDSEFITQDSLDKSCDPDSTYWYKCKIDIGQYNLSVEPYTPYLQDTIKPTLKNKYDISKKSCMSTGVLARLVRIIHKFKNNTCVQMQTFNTIKHKQKFDKTASIYKPATIDSLHSSRPNKQASDIDNWGCKTYQEWAEMQLCIDKFYSNGNCKRVSALYNNMFIETVTAPSKEFEYFGKIDVNKFDMYDTKINSVSKLRSYEQKLNVLAGIYDDHTSENTIKDALFYVMHEFAMPKNADNDYVYRRRIEDANADGPNPSSHTRYKIAPSVNRQGEAYKQVTDDSTYYNFLLLVQHYIHECIDEILANKNEESVTVLRYLLSMTSSVPSSMKFEQHPSIDVIPLATHAQATVKHQGMAGMAGTAAPAANQEYDRPIAYSINENKIVAPVNAEVDTQYARFFLPRANRNPVWLPPTTLPCTAAGAIVVGNAIAGAAINPVQNDARAAGDYSTANAPNQAAADTASENTAFAHITNAVGALVSGPPIAKKIVNLSTLKQNIIASYMNGGMDNAIAAAQQAAGIATRIDAGEACAVPSLLNPEYVEWCYLNIPNVLEDRADRICAIYGADLVNTLFDMSKFAPVEDNPFILLISKEYYNKVINFCNGVEFTGIYSNLMELTKEELIDITATTPDISIDTKPLQSFGILKDYSKLCKDKYSYSEITTQKSSVSVKRDVSKCNQLGEYVIVYKNKHVSDSYERQNVRSTNSEKFRSVDYILCYNSLSFSKNLEPVGVRENNKMVYTSSKRLISHNADHQAGVVHNMNNLIRRMHKAFSNTDTQYSEFVNTISACNVGESIKDCVYPTYFEIGLPAAATSGVLYQSTETAVFDTKPKRVSTISELDSSVKQSIQDEAFGFKSDIAYLIKCAKMCKKLKSVDEEIVRSLSIQPKGYSISFTKNEIKDNINDINFLCINQTYTAGDFTFYHSKVMTALNNLEKFINNCISLFALKLPMDSYFIGAIHGCTVTPMPINLYFLVNTTPLSDGPFNTPQYKFYNLAIQYNLVPELTFENCAHILKSTNSIYSDKFKLDVLILAFKLRGLMNATRLNTGVYEMWNRDNNGVISFTDKPNYNNLYNKVFITPVNINKFGTFVPYINIIMMSRDRSALLRSDLYNTSYDSTYSDVSTVFKDNINGFIDFVNVDPVVQRVKEIITESEKNKYKQTRLNPITLL